VDLEYENPKQYMRHFSKISNVVFVRYIKRNEILMFEQDVS